MTKITKRVVEKFQSENAGTETYLWDSELKGFGARLYPSGVVKFVVKYRTAGGQQRKLSLGAFGPLTVENARVKAIRELVKVLDGGDPAADKQAHRFAMTVAEMCDSYMASAEKGLVLGRKGTAKKPSTIYIDKGRIDRHIKPLIGPKKARDISRTDIEHLKTGIATGKTATDIKTVKFGRAIVKGGKGTATRALGLLGGIFEWAKSQGIVSQNPVRGVRRFADKQRKFLLSAEQYRSLGTALDLLAAKRDRNDKEMHHALGLAALRFIALTGVRRGEAQSLKWSEVDLAGCALRFGDTKTGESFRPLGNAARDMLEGLVPVSDYVFPSLPKGEGYQGLPRVWRLVRSTARDGLANGDAGPLDEVTMHGLRHSLAGTAENLDCSIPTIATLLGHRLPGVTAGYVMKRLDLPLIGAADRVTGHIDRVMRGEVLNDNQMHEGQ